MRLTTGTLGPEAFDGVVRRLDGATGVTRSTAQNDGFVWVSESPLIKGAPVERQLEWATTEAEIIAKNLGTDRKELRLEVWLAVAVPGQRGFLCREELMARLATAGADLVVNLYNWD